MTTEFRKLIDGLENKGYKKINGRYFEPYYGYGDLEEKWSISQDNDIVKLDHWGTTILQFDAKNKRIASLYSQSKTDSKYIQLLLQYFDCMIYIGWSPLKDSAYLLSYKYNDMERYILGNYKASQEQLEFINLNIL